MHRADPSTLVTSLFAGWRENKDEKRAARRARQSHSRERWLGTNPRTVGAARRRFLSRFAKDPDRAFDVAEHLMHLARYREEKELAVSLLAELAPRLTEAHLLRCVDWLTRIADTDLSDRLARTLGPSVCASPGAQRRLNQMARAMDPMQRRAALQCAHGSLEGGTEAIRTALLLAEMAAADRSPLVQEALAELLADVGDKAPRQALPFLARFSDDLPTRVLDAALSMLPATLQRQVQADLQSRGR